jgi:methionine-S-sulfoxide reductase
MILIFTLSFGVFALEKATFAGGCFWCMEKPFEDLKGVKSVISGFSGGDIKNPSYDLVSSGKTKHIEVVQVTYDPKLISYNDLLKVFWGNIIPTDKGGQFADRGYQYTTAIFYHNDSQKKLATNSKDFVSSLKIKSKSIVTPITKFKNFYPAEDYHQDFYKKNAASIKRYKAYRKASKRDEKLGDFWKGVVLNFDKKKTK